MLNLNKKEWGEFAINDLFNVSGTITTHPSKLISEGCIPRITCSSTNNGLENTYANMATENGGVLTVDSATVGFVSYQEADFIATDHVEKIFNTKRINRNLGLALVVSIKTATLNKFNYGYKFSQWRIKRQKILLPINEANKPDYKYMEDYTKSIIDKKIEKYKIYTNSTLNSIKYKEIEKLEDKEWKEFFLTDIFSKIQRGKRLITSNQQVGNKPYVSSTSLNNGIDNFISNQESVRLFSDCLSIANSGSVGASFYHPYEFVASDHITHLKKEGMSKFVYLFISTLTNGLSKKYNFNREINDKRISREKILLPVNDQEQPDYEYMEQYMKNLMYKKIKQYLEYIEKQSS
ncbi:MAG: restriction endonuclease subunit S [Sulfurospirillum sp.]